MSFWYDYIKPKYQDSVKLCYTDKDSLMIKIKLKVFINRLQIMLKKDLSHQIMKFKTRY